jgi:hypothetical protein
MSFRGRTKQNVINAGTRPVLRVLRNPHTLCDLIGRGETDAVDILRQGVWVPGAGENAISGRRQG